MTLAALLELADAQITAKVGVRNMRNVEECTLMRVGPSGLRNHESNGTASLTVYAKESVFQCSAPSAPSPSVGYRAPDSFLASRESGGTSTPAAPAIALNTKESPSADPSKPAKPPAIYGPSADESAMTTIWFSQTGEIAEVVPAPNRQRYPSTKRRG